MTKALWMASALAFSSVLAGCASTPNFPIDSAPAQPAPAAAPPQIHPPIPEQTAPRPAPTDSIDSQALPPLLSPGERASQPTYRAPPPAQTDRFSPSDRTPPSRPVNGRGSVPCPPAAPARPAAKPLASGKVVTDAPPPVTVGKGDTLIAISRKTGILVAPLADLNNLEKPYKLKPGQKIKLPSRRYYKVESGDTIYALARRFSVDAADLAEFNDITAGAKIRAGDKIYLPEKAKDKGAPKADAPKPVRTACPPEEIAAPPVRVATPEPVPETPRAPIPYRATNPPPQTAYQRPSAPVVPGQAQIADPAAVPLTDAQITTASRGKFMWPVRGDVLQRFGPTGGGQRNDGVNIAGSPGEGVRAAAQGEVVYAGNQVPGFGNLVLIKHDGGWVTAYAHLSNIDVKMRQQIAQGQAIGQIGQTGSVDQPQLHFEVRYAPSPKEKAKPVDPMLVLPR